MAGRNPGGQSKDKGLVDELGFIEDAIDRAIELASLDKENVRVIRYSPPPSLASALGLMSQYRT